MITKAARPIRSFFISSPSFKFDKFIIVKKIGLYLRFNCRVSFKFVISTTITRKKVETEVIASASTFYSDLKRETNELIRSTLKIIFYFSCRLPVLITGCVPLSVMMETSKLLMSCTFRSSVKLISCPSSICSNAI